MRSSLVCFALLSLACVLSAPAPACAWIKYPSASSNALLIAHIPLEYKTGVADPTTFRTILSADTTDAANTRTFYLNTTSGKKEHVSTGWEQYNASESRQLYGRIRIDCVAGCNVT